MQIKAKLIVMVGFPAAGKSTWIRKYSKNYVIVELDQIRREIFGHQFHINAEPFVIAFAKSMVRLLLSQKKNVILDSTGLTRWIRQEWYNIGKNHNADITVVWIKTHEINCRRRNSRRLDPVPEEAMDKLINNFEEPTIDAVDGSGVKLIEVKG